MAGQKEGIPASMRDEETIKTIKDHITRYFGGEDKVPITCSLKEAAKITGISYENLNSLSKSASERKRVPGFRLGKSSYSVLICELPAWIVRMTKCS